MPSHIVIPDLPNDSDERFAAVMQFVRDAQPPGQSRQRSGVEDGGERRSEGEVAQEVSEVAARIAAIKELIGKGGVDNRNEWQELCEEGLRLAEAIDSPLDCAKFCAIRVGLFLFSGNEFFHDAQLQEQAIALEVRAVSLYEEHGTLRERMLEWWQLGQLYTLVRRYAYSVGPKHRALALAQECGDMGAEAEILCSLSDSYGKAGESERASTYALRALEIAESLEDADRIAYASRELGKALSQCGDHGKGVEFLEKACRLYRSAENLLLEIDSLGLLGDCLRMMGEHERSAESYRRALVLSEAPSVQYVGYLHDRAKILEGLGRTWLEMGRLDEAAQALHRAIDLYTDPNALGAAVNDTLPVLVALADLSAQQGDDGGVSRYLDRALAVVDGEPRELSLAHQMYVRYFEERGDAAQTLRHYREHYRIQTEIEREESRHRLEWMQVQLDMEKHGIAARIKGEQMKHELAIARAAQLSMLPASPPNIPGLTVAASCTPALEVGGDYFDFIRLSEEQLGIAVGDVMGKGMPAAMHMALLKGVLRSFAVAGASPGLVLADVNRHLYDMLRRGWFVSMIYAVIDTGARTLCYASAGHNPVLIVRDGATVVPAPGGGMALGLASGALFERAVVEQRLELERGDRVVLYTDGWSEAMNAEQEEYGEERLHDAVLRHAVLPPEELLAVVGAEVSAFAAGALQHDDMTMIVVEIGE